MKGSITRAVALIALTSAPAFAGPAWEPQQTGSAGSAPTASAAPRARRSTCVGCSDSARAKHDLLISKLDSLRWEFVNRRLTEAEQRAFDREMGATILALQQFMEANMRASAGQGGASGGIARSGGAGGAVSASGYTMTVQTSKRGYIGITFDGPSYGYPPERPDVIRFIQYPKIASVDPASPAERAGLLMGDTLLAMNGTDVVENSITLSKLLIPDEKVTLRVRRDGDAKEFRVSVAEAPAYIVRRVTPLPPEFRALPAYPGQQPAPGAPVRVEVRTPEAPVAAQAPDVPVPARLFVFGAGVGGARVETLTEGLAKLAGTKEGVMVTVVPPGSPAFFSGLRDGDVIISAAGSVVTSTGELTNALRYADRENGVKLVIVREKKQQDVVLRWK
jgi:membrane-associated protease RseP (regulator of RpoE activity)